MLAFVGVVNHIDSIDGISLQFENDSTIAMSELYYIQQTAG